MKSLFLALLLLAATAQTLTAQRSVHRKHKPKLFRSVDVEYWNTTDSIILGGTLTIPNQRGKRFPAVILISGSGTQDRDYTAYKNYKMFKEIAEYLSARGIAVLRVDDRGAGKTGFKGPGYFSPRIKASLNPLITDLTRDVQYGLAYLKTRRDINSKQIGLLGHSLGGVVATSVASQVPVFFIVSMASPVITGKQMAVEQWRNLLLDRGVDSITVNKFEKYFFDPLFTLTVDRISNKDLEMSSLTIIHKLRANMDSISLKKVGFEKYTDQDLKIIINHNVTSPIFNEIILVNPAKFLVLLECPILSLFAINDSHINTLTQVTFLYKLLKENEKLKISIFILSKLNHVFIDKNFTKNHNQKLIKNHINHEVLKIIFTWIKNLTPIKKHFTPV